MLSELKLSNFRIFDDEVTVRFRPITVLIGRNSSGKSSIIKFLLMLQQSLAPGQARFLNPEGNKVSLGAFTALKNALTKKQYLTFELSANITGSRVEPAVARRLGSLEEVNESNLFYKTTARVLYSRRTSRGRTSYSLANSSSGKNLLQFNVKPLEDSSFWDYPPFPGVLHSLSQSEDEDETQNNIRPRLAQLKRMQASLSQSIVERSVVDTLRYQINSIRHLLPVRAEAQRVILASYPPMDDVGNGGEYALPHLQELIAGPGDGYEFIRPYLENIVGIEAVRFKTSSGYVSQAYAKNKTTGADVLIADYGFGVGQCLPILVQGAIMAPQTTLMVEQPEAQLHPTAQLEMGSFFADLWNTRNVGSVIETHSDNILLRLRRLIARGELSHQDVSVAFFTFDEDNGNMPIVKNLDIKEDGSMQAGLPMEFFGADVIEGLQLGARA